MGKFLCILILVCGFTQHHVVAQTKMLRGKVLTSQDAENVHVINKSSKKNTITNSFGLFEIEVKLQDTLIFSSLQHELQMLMVDQETYKNGTVVITLLEHVNKLDEVTVGKVLTGNMNSDVANVRGEPMTSKKAGILSYQGKPLTQTQRHLKDAGDLDPKLGGSLGGLGASIRLVPVINAITGRTKEMKTYVQLEEKEALMYHLKTHISETVFADYPLEDVYIMEFLFFVSEQPDFLQRCKNKSAVNHYEYLKEKLFIYYDNKNIKYP
ncbi:hypothetical protein [Bizionia sp.]|uniref:hypothetical protein n=1 Tax=Bizionia sp. TaxID=1954480 RepID=UPI003A94863B